MTVAQKPDRDHRVLGHRRWTRRVALAAGHAVPHPRELRGGSPEEGLRVGGGIGGDRCRGRTASRWLRHHLPVVARRLPPRSRRHRWWCCRRSSSSATWRTPDLARSTWSAPILSVIGMGGVVLGILVWQEGGEAVGLLMALGAIALSLLAYWLVRRKRAGKADPARPRSVPVPAFPDRDLPADAATDHPRRRDDRAPDLLADDARVQRDAGGPVARPAVAQHVRSGHARRTQGGEPPPEQHHPGGLRAQHPGDGVDHPDRAPSRLRLGARRPAADHGIGVGSGRARRGDRGRTGDRRGGRGRGARRRGGGDDGLEVGERLLESSDRGGVDRSGGWDAERGLELHQ